MKSLQILLYTLFICHLTSVMAQIDRPKLVVGIIVDQMRQDYLWRYHAKLSEGGFRRLLSEGFEYKNAHYNYAPTYTGPGHASVYTGTTPSRHGIIANDWYSRTLKRMVYCAEDTLAKAVGGAGKNGEISAVNLKSTTITDELGLFFNKQSKVVAVAIKDRGAALPAGHFPTGAYWYDDDSGDFISSDYYMKKLPQWAITFNNEKRAKGYAGKKWETLLPLSDYNESLSDLSVYEGLISGKDKPIFPYTFSKENVLNEIKTSPFGNTLTLDFALAALTGENMGRDNITDFMAISFSSPDYIGHVFGPRSVEVEDNYLRLDKEIERLLNNLDQTVGKDEYIVFLTADHAVVDVPQYLVDNQLPGGYVSGKEFSEKLNVKVAEILGEGTWIESISNQQIFLNHSLLIEKEKDDLDEIQAAIAQTVVQWPEVAEAYTASTLGLRQSTDVITTRIQNGYNQQLSGDILMVPSSGYLTSNGRVGTSHGTPYSYDTHVPIVFFGKNIPKGSSVREVSITDIAPSLSMLLHISLPSATTGQVLLELFTK